jgi:RimJ/RimL family protein N-acetyltransferase
MLVKQNPRRLETTLEHARPWFKTRGGTTLHLRTIRPEDAARLVEFFLHLSPDTRWRRFHVHIDNISPAQLADRARPMAEVDNRTDEGAVLALLGRGEDEEIVGVVRLARPEGQPAAPEAEAAVVVRDDFHGQGVGTELLRWMVLLAKAMHIETIVAIFQSDNEDAMRLFRELDLPYILQAHSGEMEMRIEVPQEKAN